MKRALSYDGLGIDEQEADRRMVKLRRPVGRSRDASIVGIYHDALRHKDGALTVAYYVETPATMFADDALVDIRYDELARMLAFEKPPGTVVQFRYSTTPDPGQAITNVFASRATAGTHALASLLQASNLDCLRSSVQSFSYRRSVQTLWVRVPPKQRSNSTISALADFSHALGEEMKRSGSLGALRNVKKIYSRTADDSVVRRTLEDEKRAYAQANRVWRQIENSSPLQLRRFTRQELWEAVFFGHCQTPTLRRACRKGREEICAITCVAKESRVS